MTNSLITKNKIRKEPGAYLLKDDQDNILYVGSTGNLYQRFHEHKSSINKKQHHNPNLQKHIENNTTLIFEPIITSSKEEAVTIEQSYITQLHGNGLLCNISTDAICGGKGHIITPETQEKMTQSRIGLKRPPEVCRKIGDIHRGKVLSDETKTKISESKKGISTATDESRRKQSEASKGNTYRLGTTHSDETKQKMSETRTGRHYSESHCDNISEALGTAVIIDGIRYSSANRAGKELNMDHKSVLFRCRSNKYPNWIEE